MVVMAEDTKNYQMQYGVTDFGSGAMRGAATGAMLGAKLGGPLFGAGGMLVEERADAERALMDPQRAIMRQQTATAPQVDDAAIAARILLGREQQEQQAERAVQTEISKLNMEERKMEEQRIAQLMESRKQAASQARQDTYYMAGQAMGAMAENEALRAKLGPVEAMMQKQRVTDSKLIGVFDDLQTRLGGGFSFTAELPESTNEFMQALDQIPD
jgi:hypothetical protein